ncbi:protein NLRC3 [Embiotoca jacksoni]|uniref:protein NLRC3 n=1 Tax=Embiotoca jacksoni TaxID=100190 RepID=UPI0037037A1C
MDAADDEMMASASSGSFIGDAVSARGEIVTNEDDGLFYIPERRPSLDLGPSPMDINHGHYVEQALSPAQSYGSMTSEEGSDKMEDEDGSYTRVQLDRTGSFSSCYSFDSDECEKRTRSVASKDDVSEPPDHELILDPNEISHPSLTLAFTLTAICKTLQKLPEEDFKTFKRTLWKRYPQSFNMTSQGMDLLNLLDFVDQLIERYNLQVSLQITKKLLVEMDHKKIADDLQTLCIRNEVRHDLSEILRKKYEVCEDLDTEGEKRSSDDVFTNLYITSTSDNGPNIEHEVMKIEKLDTNQKAGERLSTRDILNTERLEHSNVKIILMTGVAGSGKSTVVRRLVLDWIEERSPEHVSFLFPLPFRELKQFQGSKVSLLEIIQTLYPATKKLKDDSYCCEDCNTVFVFDGLDEYNEKLEFENTELLRDLSETTTLNTIVVNLLRGRLFYYGLFLVTSRPQVKTCIPWDTPYDEIEVRGFQEREKDEYFKKRFKDPDQAARVIEYVSSFRTLQIMCHLPLFCSLVADECQHIFKEQGTQAALPRSITYMYTKLLLELVRQRRIYRAPSHSLDQERDFLMKLGKLAFTMLEQGQFKITKLDWQNVEINEQEAVINSGLCTQYDTMPHILFHERVLSFIQPTMQEYLAALYAFLTFTNQGMNVFEQQLKGKLKGMFKGHKATGLLKSAVDRSLLCADGKLDIVLRFLFGMVLKTNLDLLQPYYTSPLKETTTIDDAAALLRKRIRDNPNKTRNLQCCLEELGV